VAGEAGERGPCPDCGTEVLEKSMIPILGTDGTGIRYVCVECARKLIVESQLTR
jgi:DNA-directed RNA polymerase subunit RPC12/RpoP